MIDLLAKSSAARSGIAAVTAAAIHVSASVAVWAEAPRTSHDILFCAHKLLWCWVPEEAQKVPYFSPRRRDQTLSSFLPLERTSIWRRFDFPVSTAPAQPATATRTLEAPKGAVKLRAGMVEDSDSDPDFPKIVLGTAAWTAIGAADGERTGSIVVDVDLASGQSGVRLVFRLSEKTGQLNIEGELKGNLAKSKLQLLEMPRARRTSATEGEPLAGRINTDDSARFLVELASDSRDAANNWRRLTQSPWLDLRIGPADGSGSVVTIEKGRVGNEMIMLIFKALAPP